MGTCHTGRAFLERANVVTRDHRSQRGSGEMPAESVQAPIAHELVHIRRSAGLGSGGVAEVVRSGGSLEGEVTPPPAKTTPPQRLQVPTASS